MTSPTSGMTRSVRRPETVGFTLIELLLVVSLIVVLAAIVFPNLSRSTRARDVTRVAEEVAEFVRYGRLEALRTETPARLEFDRRRGEYRLTKQAFESVEQGRFVPFEDDFLGVYRPLGRVDLTRIVVEGQPQHTSHLTFEPSGVGAHTVLEFRGDEDFKAFVEIGPWVDDVSVRTDFPEVADESQPTST